MWEHRSPGDFLCRIQYDPRHLGRLPTATDRLDIANAEAEKDWYQCYVCAWSCVSCR